HREVHGAVRGAERQGPGAVERPGFLGRRGQGERDREHEREGEAGAHESRSVRGGDRVDEPTIRAGPMARQIPGYPATVDPPRIGRTSPVMKLESADDAKNTNAGAISSGCAGRPIGVFSPKSRAAPSG